MHADLLQYGKVTLHLLLATAIPVRLVAHQHNVGRHLAESRGLEHGIDAILNAETIDDIVETFDLACIQIFLSILDQIQAILVANANLKKDSM